MSCADHPDPCVEIRIGDDPTPLWMRRSALDRGEGAVMPEPDHDAYGPFEDSYAHLMGDGRIMRYHRQIGRRCDIREIGGGE